MQVAKFDKQFVAVPIPTINLTLSLIDDYFVVRGANLVTRSSKITAPVQNPDLWTGILNKIKDSYFGQAIFIAPKASDFRHSIFCVSRDATRLVTQ